MGKKMFETIEGPKFQPRKLYRIGEIVECTGLSRQTIHNYTVMGLISEAERSQGNQRLYSQDVFDRLSRIIAMKKQGMKMVEIRRLLEREENRV
jgi:DNA-binding transcriptional MerR regulator